MKTIYENVKKQFNYGLDDVDKVTKPKGCKRIAENWTGQKFDGED